MNYPPAGPPPYPPQYPPPQPGYGAGPPPAATEGKALTSLILGLLSLFCFGILTGIPAVVVGVLSRRDIARSGHSLGGGGLAVGGIVTGALGSLMSLATIGMMIFGMVAASRAGSSFVPPPPMTPPPGSVGGGSIAMRTVGAVEIVEARVGAGALRDQLLDARSDAVKAGRTLLVEVRAKWCLATCTSFDSALLDPRMQGALRDVRILRVDLDDFASELGPLSMLTQAVPYFYLIDSSAQAEASLSADAWEDNTAANMAPVFGTFLHHPAAAPRDAGAGSKESDPQLPPHAPSPRPRPISARDAGGLTL